MTLEVVPCMHYSYGPFQTEEAINSLFPGANDEHYKRRRFAQPATAIFHEHVMQTITGGEIVGGNKRELCDIVLPDGRQIENKSSHYRYPFGRKNWVFQPVQLKKLGHLSRADLGEIFVTLFAYMIPDDLPERATQEYGKYIIQQYQSLFLIFMRYGDCLDLLKQGQMIEVKSGTSKRILLPYRAIIDLLLAKIASRRGRVYSNINPINGAGSVPLLGRGVRHNVRNLILGINVHPLDIAPNLARTVWEKQYGDAPEAKIA